MEKSPKNKIKIKIQASKDESHIINILSSEFVEKNQKICKIEITRRKADSTRNVESTFLFSMIPKELRQNLLDLSHRNHQGTMV